VRTASSTLNAELNASCVLMNAPSDRTVPELDRFAGGVGSDPGNDMCTRGQRQTGNGSEGKKVPVPVLE
jgi:hypothetical protein